MTQPERTPKARGTLAIFDPAAVRISYRPPTTVIDAAPAQTAPLTTAPEVADTAELAGLAGLVWALRCAAELPGVVVVVDAQLGTNAVAVDQGRCARAPMMKLGANLLQTPQSLALYGTLAHEIAHLALGHTDTCSAPEWKHTSRVAGVGALVTLALNRPGAAATLAAVSAVLHLIASRVSRVAEYDADTYAVTLLERAGLPGVQTMTAMLTDVADDDPRWYALAGWIAGEHPAAAARLRNLSRGFTAPRRTWRTAWRCAATGTRLGTHAHRQAHHGERCRLRWWQLMPYRRPPAQR
ncbi:Peptidase family M48 [Streptosporangium subroseum]|uniref:Peptidase family M48 n=1 Tax=Streptosporangium subroseum TaxID=106412 RepID=A0A239P1W6_9ACTN|nr:M48 family metalloprotease [Streptosporangium subroseum]SNT60628.1 Peptidase family M48 [Streptosporangium subroseum]